MIGLFSGPDPEGRRRPGLLGLVALGAVVPLALLGFNSASARFSASEELGTNRIATATVDLVAGRPVTTSADGLVAPGARQYLEVVASNAGSLPLLVTVALLPDDSPTSKALTWEYWDGDCETRPDPNLVNRPTGVAVTEPPPADDTVAPGGSGLPLASGNDMTVCVAAVLPLGVSNELQGGRASYDVVFNAFHDLDVTTGEGS